SFVAVERFAENPFSYDCDCTTYLIDRKGNWHTKLEGKWISLGKEPDLSSETEPSNLRTAMERMPQKEKVFGEVHSFSRSKYPGATYYSSIENLDGSEYQVMRTKDGFGVVLGGENYLPFQYDFIDINYEWGYFILIKDKKMGIHLPNTIYSTIEPKYDLLTLDRTIKVNPKWNFVIYEVQVGEHVVYVGENGVEYFSFD
ncbi:hypothetical protein N9F08_00905, partial [bacterium]|nr:hypothetical protein [bacterium]